MEIKLNDESLERISVSKKENETEEEFVNRLIGQECPNKEEKKKQNILGWSLIIIMAVIISVICFIIQELYNGQALPPASDPPAVLFEFLKTFRV